MAWDPGSRANLNRLRQEGVVAVRYQAKGCNVELELLSNCIGSTGKYRFSPYSANEKKVAHNASELFAELPVGAARLSGKVKGNRALRTDYMLAGQYALPPNATFKRTELQGADCARATHVVSAVYVGAFAMAAGEQRAVDGRASVFGLGAGGATQADVEVLGDEGDAESCKASQKEHKENAGCGVPLRIGLAPLDAPAAPECPDGSALQGDKCLRKNVVTQVDCPAGTKWDGGKCAASVDTSCAKGLHFEAGRGCVADAVAAAPTAQAAPTVAGSGPVVCGHFQVLDPGDGIQGRGSGFVRDTWTGLTWTRFVLATQDGHSAAMAYCSSRGMRLPLKSEGEAVRERTCKDAWPEFWTTWTSDPVREGKAWTVNLWGGTRRSEVGSTKGSVAVDTSLGAICVH